MASFVKRELLKHLTRFAKNLDPAKLNISAMRGEGELTGLELDEQVLMSLLELPSWLNIKSATCNRVSIKIPWTSLKSKPIGIYLDCVNVMMETCEELRKDNGAGANLAGSGETNKYGFVERVVDGIFVQVSSVLISFKSYAFSADIDLSQISVESVGPSWDRPDDLRKTRVKDETRDQVIIFKRIQLGVIRIALNALDAHDAPILLISNNSEVQVSIKKRLNDCGFVASKVKLIIEDLLWVLNDSQIKAVLSYINMLKPLVMKAHKASQLKSGVSNSEQEQMKTSSGQSGAAGAHYASSASFRLPKNDQEVKMCKIFDINDIHETSYHLVCRRIDLHLVEDNSKRANSVPLRLEGGALQLSLRNMCLDHYPYHVVGQTFYHWENYSDLFEARNMWANQLITLFKEQYLKLKLDGKIDDLVATELHFYGSSPVSIEARSRKKKPGSLQSAPVFVPQRLMSSCFVLFLDSYALHHVTSNKTSGTEVMNGKLIYSDKSTFHIPSDVPSLLAIYTDYYFTCASPSLMSGSSSSTVHGSTSSIQNHHHRSSTYSGASSGKITSASAAHSVQSEIQQLPLPHANLHVKFNPFCVDFDPNTLIWVNAFAKRVSKDVDDGGQIPPRRQQMPEPNSTEVVLHVDLKAEFLMPQVKFTLEKHPEEQPDRPRGIEVAMSSVTMTNVHEKSLTDRKKMLSTVTDTFIARQKTSFRTHQIELAAELKQYFPNHISHVSDKGVNMLRYPGFLDTVVLEVDQVWSDWFGIKTTKLGRLPLIEPVSFSVFVSYPLLQKVVEDQRSCTGTVTPNGNLNNGVGPSTANNHLNVNGQSPSYVRSSPHANNQVTPDLLKSCSNATLSASNQQTVNGEFVHPLEQTYMPKVEPLIQIMFTSKKRVTLYLDHYQFIVLMRLQEMLVETVDIMDQDKKLILGDQWNQTGGDQKELTVSIIGVLPMLDVAFMLPPQPESADVMATRRSLLLSSTHEFTEAESNNLNIESAEVKSTSGHSSLKNQFMNDDASEGCSASIDKKAANESSGESEAILNELPNICSEQLNSIPAITIQTQDTSWHVPTNDSNADLSEMQFGRKSNLGSEKIQNSSSGYSTASSMKGATNTAKVSLTSLSSAAGSLTAKFSSASSLMGKTFTDTMSITGSEFSTGSGGYSSEDDFICLSTDGAGMLNKGTNIGPKVIDYDQELKPVNTYKPEEEFLGEERNDMPVTVMVVRMTNVEASIQLLVDNGSSVIQLAVPNIEIEDHENTTFAKFLTANAKFDREYAATMELHPQLAPAKSELPTIEVRIDSPGPVSRDLYGGVCEERGHLGVNLQNLKLDVKMTCVMAIVDLIEDELIQLVAPLDLQAAQSEINIAQDGPPSNPLTSPGPVPLNLKLKSLLLNRDADNVINIGKRYSEITDTAATFSNSLTSTVSSGEQSTHINNTTEAMMTSQNEDLSRRNRDLEEQLLIVRNQLEEALLENTALQRTLTNMQNTLMTSSNHGLVIGASQQQHQQANMQ
ncbi:bridge-like lipid transfer protein family member 3B isoform X2 [Convolutriloba macropyga]|uniref:bridge-like lipid transfer protein family member 3B isoform X2 n=1 Tax=Convolutriloba macropyga TaxID=536237 RepID=UPI003F51F724